MTHLTVLDLFSGCGGMSWGLHKSGFRVVAGIDFWEPALRTFRLNHPDAQAIAGDVTALNPSIIRKKLHLAEGELDCIVGGPPCQSFSKNVPAAYRFLEDPRNHLFRDFLSFVSAFQPKAVVMENVAEIFNAYDGGVREEIVTTFEKLGYTVVAKVLFAPDFGVPQRRRRCFFFASRTGTSPAIPTPQFARVESVTLLERIEGYRSAWEAISDLPVLRNGEGTDPAAYDQEATNDFQREMRRDSPVLWNHVTRKLNETQMARVSSISAGQGIKDLPKHLRPRSGYSGAYGRLDYGSLAPTVTRWVFHPGSGRYCHPREDRLITTREAARLQSFSDDFRFTGTFIEMAHQIGNAVPPMLMKAFAPRITAICRGERTTSQSRLRVAGAR